MEASEGEAKVGRRVYIGGGPYGYGVKGMTLYEILAVKSFQGTRSWGRRDATWNLKYAGSGRVFGTRLRFEEASSINFFFCDVAVSEW